MKYGHLDVGGRPANCWGGHGVPPVLPWAPWEGEFVVFRVTIAVGGAQPDLNEEIRLLKAGLIYGDSVRLVSPLAVLLGSLATLVDPSEDDLLDLLRSTAPSLMPGDSTAVLGLLDLYVQLGAKKRRTRHELLMYQSMRAKLVECARELHETCVGLLERAGAQHLAVPLESGLLEIRNLTEDPPGPGSFDADRLTLAFAQELGRAFERGDSYLLLDDASGQLLRSMILEGIVSPSRGVVSKGKQVGTAHLFMEELPAFPDATVDELMDLRSDLERHLDRFRSAMGDTAREIRARQFDPGFAGEVKNLWVERVEPEIADIRARVFESGFCRVYAERVRESVGPLIGTGAGLLVGLALRPADLTEKAVELATAATGLAAATAVDAVRARGRMRSGAQQSGFYLLYELNRNLESVAGGQ